jgi:hypothetical protein
VANCLPLKRQMMMTNHALRSDNPLTIGNCLSRLLKFPTHFLYRCRICRSYEALCGGLTSEALTDFTGGIVQRFEIDKTDSKELWQIMSKASAKRSLMGCSIDVSRYVVLQYKNGTVL